MKYIKDLESFIVEKAKWAKDVKVEEGGMHKALGIDSDKRIEDVYTSGKKLAEDLINKVGRKKAASMINYAANVDKSDNVFDTAQRALSSIED